MKYVGSKAKHAKEILSIVLKDRKPNQIYVEPFVGGFNIIDKVIGPRIANDSNIFLIALFRAVQNGWMPPDFVSEEEYREIKNNQTKYDPAMVGFVGFACSYAAKWFGGYARGKNSKGEWRNYALESKKFLLKQVPAIKDVIIKYGSYLDLIIPDNSIVYCDPPYFGTTGYKDKINYEIFWDWVREISKKNTVYISEYNAPDDFICVWQKEITNSLDNIAENRNKIGIEKLFTLKKKIELTT